MGDSLFSIREHAMKDTLDPCEIAFKQVANGWIFSPAVAALGPMLGSRSGSYYLLSDARKAAVKVAIVNARLASQAIAATYALACGLAAIALFAGLIWMQFQSLPQLPPKQGISMPLGAGVVALGLAPFALTFAWLLLAMRRVLAGVPRTSERISAAEYRAKEASTTPLGHMQLQLQLQFAGCMLAAAMFLNQIGRDIGGGQLASATVWSVGLVYLLSAAVRAGMTIRRKRRLANIAASNP